MNEMKSKILFIVMLISACVIPQSCNDDEEPVKKVLIVGSMFTGQFYTVNLTDGSLTELFMPTLGGDDLLNVRTLVYHPGKKKYFALLTRQSGGKLLSIDPTTKVATVINDNSVDPWYQLSSLIVTSDDSLLAVGDFGSAGEGFTKFGTDGSRSDRLIINENGMCCGYGMIYFSKQKQIVVANGYDQPSPYDGTVNFDTYTDKAEYVNTFTILNANITGFTDDLSQEYLAIRSMASKSDSNTGDVYGVMIAYNSGNSYLVKIDLTGKKIQWVADLDTTGDYDFAPLTFVSESVANK
jgi:hypothetical protein